VQGSQLQARRPSRSLSGRVEGLSSRGPLDRAAIGNGNYLKSIGPVSDSGAMGSNENLEYGEKVEKAGMRGKRGR